MNDNYTKAELNALAKEKLDELGKSYGRIIFQKVVLFDLGLGQLQAGVDAAVGDFRAMSAAAGVCDHDIEIGAYWLEMAIIQEGRRLAEMLPEHEPETVQ